MFGPLGMVDTGFEVPAAKRGRFTSSYRSGDDGNLELADGPDGEWSSLPALPLGNGGLAPTADDWLAFCRMLRAGGRRQPSAVGQLRTHDDDRPYESGSARHRPAVPGGPGLGLRWLGRYRPDQAVECAGPLRLGRRHGHSGARDPGNGCNHYPADPGGSDGSGAGPGDQGVLAVRG
ncbi:serine hydrolase [Streptomyces sp. NPDC056309]|uniref:serine hydrolase n=1 Tax=unclassified Streptomyces TaxID=2593676 RepID=UPI0035E07A70